METRGARATNGAPPAALSPAAPPAAPPAVISLLGPSSSRPFRIPKRRAADAAAEAAGPASSAGRHVSARLSPSPTCGPIELDAEEDEEQPPAIQLRGVAIPDGWLESAKSVGEGSGPALFGICPIKTPVRLLLSILGSARAALSHC